MAQVSNQTTVLSISPEAARQRELDALLGVGFALLILVVTIGLVLRRSAQHVAESPGRFWRVLYAAGGFSGAVTLMLVVESLWRSGQADQLVPSAMAVALFCFGAGAVLFGVADVWLVRKHPVRSRGWLVAACLLFGALLLGIVALLVWRQDGFLSLLDPGLLQSPIFGAIAGAIWWSCLPTQPSDIVRTFE